MTMSNIFSMLPEILVMKYEETSTWIAVVSKFDWETKPWWSQKEKGTVMVETKKGTRFIKDVLLVPNLKENLLSISQMVEKGYALHFKVYIYTIYDNYNKRQEITQVKMEKRNRSFPISFKYTTNIAMKVEVDDSWLWHQRFGHFNS
ncbi:hypothetical protein CR513_47273, partial [Mucuna pruriens]